MKVITYVKLTVLCAGILLASAPAWCADATPRGSQGDVVTLNFVNADIEGVVKAVGEITGKNFLLDPRVQGTVNIISAKPISRSLAEATSLSA